MTPRPAPGGLRALLRRWLPPQSWLGGLLRRARHHQRLRRYAGPQLIAAFARAYPDAFFVQVGSNDGDQQDPLADAIRHGAWRGIMIEPVPYVFAGLKRNYGGNPRIALENVAIADRDGTLPFYHLQPAGSDDKLPRWYDALGSFSREVVAKHVKYIPDIEQRIVCSPVPSLSFDSLCARHGVARIDLLHTDCEGYDYEIIRRIDFSRYRPRLLIYEHHHLKAADRAQCRAQLERLGYGTLEEGLDTWCCDLQPGDGREAALLKLWRRLVVRPVGAAAPVEAP